MEILTTEVEEEVGSWQRSCEGIMFKNHGDTEIIEIHREFNHCNSVILCALSASVVKMDLASCYYQLFESKIDSA